MSETILQTQDVVQRFGGLTAVNRVSMKIEKNQIVGLIGPNGAGKTTFFNVITGVNTPTEGSVAFKGRMITGLPAHQIVEHGIARTFQNIRLFKNMTAQENVIAGMHSRTKSTLLDCIFRTPRHRKETRECEARADELLRLVGLYEYRFDLATSLPYGHQRRLEIARALASDPVLLLLDEPAAGMNEQETAELLSFICQIRDMGYTILLIEHDMKLVMSVCENIYVLDHGELIAQGEPEQIKNDARVIEAYLGKEA
ncbi:ABC transporter ATP-binding protein [Agathobaculum sp.]|uniref:ABC transporter ATP-binding protein n=1 Tax=Agathobaculum sp. TaxID=2048138 RepID=UPI002A80E41C|nr:ABC transporter ATP-binding protein [Agathobaculum sp.]MDY3617884.1 ABC transporter ATP-binding protein [Agathobaculum sp.]